MTKKGQKKKESRNLSVIAFVKFLAFILPLVLYLVSVTCIFPAPNSGFITMGVIGSFIVGLGLVSVAGLLDKQYFGNIITGIVLGFGALLILISSLIMYTPSIYTQLDEENVTFYFVTWSFLVVPAIYYLFFRHAVSLHLRSEGLSKTRLEDLKKGMRNYWLYDRAHLEFGLGWIYIVNKWFVIQYLCTITLQLILGWWKLVYPVTTFSVLLLSILTLPMFGLVISTWDQVRSNKRKLHVYELLIGGFTLPILVCIAIVKLLFRTLS